MKVPRDSWHCTDINRPCTSYFAGAFGYADAMSNMGSAYALNRPNRIAFGHLRKQFGIVSGWINGIFAPIRDCGRNIDPPLHTWVQCTDDSIGRTGRESCKAAKTAKIDREIVGQCYLGFAWCNIYRFSWKLGIDNNEPLCIIIEQTECRNQEKAAENVIEKSA